ncbi:hypothetical protein FACS189450_12640 [Spirochaetia bacterium]|nr:hypothetical protein FACS189450_12640 [Spirochaetia bacterium]
MRLYTLVAIFRLEDGPQKEPASVIDYEIKHISNRSNNLTINPQLNNAEKYNNEQQDHHYAGPMDSQYGRNDLPEYHQ